MPSTRKRRTRRSKIETIQDWQLQFLLTGAAPANPQEQGLNPFEVLTFCGADPNEDHCRFGNVDPWFNIWRKIRNSDYVQEWAKKNGMPYAEKLLEAHINANVSME